MSDTLYNTGVDVFGKRVRHNEDWFQASIAEMEPVIEAKRAAHVSYRRVPSVANLESLRRARGDAQRTARRCANEYWLQLSENIQTAADLGRTQDMYSGIRKALGPAIRKTAPLRASDGSVITDRSKQMDRLAEYYGELYSQDRTITEAARDVLEQQPVMTDLDDLPSREELCTAIDSLANGKSPGKDGIPSELLKVSKDTVFFQHLFELLCQCWEEGRVPQEMRDSNIVTLYKNKGDRSDCNNYRGISLLCVVGKAFARVVLSRLQLLAARVYPESQCGFRAERSTVDMIFALRQLQEKCQEQRKSLYIVFIDLTKAFDLVSRVFCVRLVALPEY
jgi:hypothetical protein